MGDARPRDGGWGSWGGGDHTPHLKNQKGRMSRSYSTEMVEQALRDRLDTLTGFGSAESKARKLVEVFKKVDYNGSGAVDRPEFEAAMAELNFLDVPGIMGMYKSNSPND